MSAQEALEALKQWNHHTIQPLRVTVKVFAQERAMDNLQWVRRGRSSSATMGRTPKWLDRTPGCSVFYHCVGRVNAVGSS